MCRTSRNAVPGRQFLKVIEADQKAEAEAREADRVEQQAAQDARRAEWEAQQGQIPSAIS